MTMMRVISDSSKLLEIRSAWDLFVIRHSENPFFLSRFIQQFLASSRSKGWTPLLLTIWDHGSIVGIVPLTMKKLFGIRYARCLLAKSCLSPDFVVSDDHREECVSKALDFLFTTLRCHIVQLTLPASSSHAAILEKMCKRRNVRFFQTEDMGHLIVPVNCTWNEFLRSTGTKKARKNRQDLRRTERRLNEIGPWRIVHLEGAGDWPKALKHITHVERASWKEVYRTRSGQQTDDLLMTIWTGSQYANSTEQTESTPNPHVWYLESNHCAAAYLFLLEYRNTAFAVKSSYGTRYAALSPGIFLMNEVFRQLFEERKVTKIDFLADVSFARTWTSRRLGRVTCIMTRSTGLYRIVAGAFRMRSSRHLTRMIPDWVLKRIKLNVGLDG